MRRTLRTSLTGFGLCAVCLLSACDTGTPKQSGSESKTSTAPPVVASSGAVNERGRFVFPTQPQPFAPASVALDSRTGNLCKTYAWPDKPGLPQGLAICSESENPSGAGTQGGAVPVTDPRGKTHYFPNQAAADAFKKAAGIENPDVPPCVGGDVIEYVRDKNGKLVRKQAATMVRVQIPGYPPGEIDASRLADFKKKYPNAVVLK